MASREKEHAGSVLSSGPGEQLEAQGFIDLRGALAQSAVDVMLGRVWGFLQEHHRIRKDDPRTWNVERPTGFQELTRRNSFESVPNETVTAALDRLLGTGNWRRPKHWGAPLVAFPSAGAWRLPTNQWHLDFTVTDPSRLPGIRVLALLSDTPVDGGPTLILCGSPRLLRGLKERNELPAAKSAAVRAALEQRYASIKTLWSTRASDRERLLLMEQGFEADGVHLRVVALSGKPGDVFLMHPWALHAPSPNRSASPRFMISESVFASNT